MKLFKVFISAILAGILIGIGGCVYIAYQAKSSFLASLLFSFGLFTIIMFNLHLYTGKIGYLFENEKKYFLELLIIFIGNAIGSILIGLVLRCTRYIKNYQQTIDNIVNIKINDNLLSIFVLAFLCGIMIYFAVEGSKIITSGFPKTFAIVVPIIIFILSGFEHVIANIFYFTVSGSYEIKMLLYLFVMLIGNSLGSITIWGLKKLMTSEVV